MPGQEGAKWGAARLQVYVGGALLWCARTKKKVGSGPEFVEWGVPRTEFSRVESQAKKRPGGGRGEGLGQNLSSGGSLEQSSLGVSMAEQEEARWRAWRGSGLQFVEWGVPRT
eukprot:1697985-Pyramimonas_sp.AAC.1